MLSRESWRLIVLAVAVVVFGFAIETYAQSRPGGSKVRRGDGSQVSRASPNLHEDDEVKILIPAGWSISKGDHPAVDSYEAVGSSVSQAKRNLLLAKNGYTLALAYDTEHASGIEGGRFIEMLRIPWLDPNDAWDCSLHFEGKPWPASRKLMFVNLIFRTDDPKVR